MATRTGHYSTVLPDATKLKSTRLERGLTQRDLAELAKISVGSIENAESGNKVKKETLERISRVLNVPMESLLASELVITQEMIEALPLPVFIKDKEGKYLGCNQRFCDFLERKREKIIGKEVFDVAPDGHATTYRSKDEELFAKPGQQTYESTVVAGRTERRVIFYKGTFPPSSQSPKGIIGVISDITDYKPLPTKPAVRRKRTPKKAKNRRK